MGDISVSPYLIVLERIFEADDNVFKRGGF